MAITLAERVHVAAQFGLVLAFAMYVLWLRADHPLAFQAASAAAVLFGLATIGGVLDGRAAAPWWEGARLTIFAAIGAWLVRVPASPAAASAGMVLLAGSTAGVGTLLWISLDAKTRIEGCRVAEHRSR